MWKSKKKKNTLNLSKLEISAPLTEPAHIGASSTGGINLTNIASIPQPVARPSNTVINGISNRTPSTAGSNKFAQNYSPNFQKSSSNLSNSQYNSNIHQHSSNLHLNSNTHLHQNGQNTAFPPPANYHQRQPSQTSRSTPTPPPQVRHAHTASNASTSSFPQNIPNSSSNNSLTAPPAPPPRPQNGEIHAIQENSQNQQPFLPPASPNHQIERVSRFSDDQNFTAPQPGLTRPAESIFTSALDGNIPSTSELIEVKLSRRPKGDFGFSLRRQVYSKRLDSGHSIRQAIFFAEPGGNIDYDIGLQKEDQLLKVNGIDIAGKGQQEIVDIIKSRGNVVSFVVLTVARHNFGMVQNSPVLRRGWVKTQLSKKKLPRVFPGPKTGYLDPKRLFR